MSALRFDGVSLGYGEDNVLDDVSFAVNEGEMVGVLGPNGSGKTTLIRSATGGIPARRGKVVLNDRRVTEYTRRDLARTVAVIPQEGTPIFPYTVLEAVLMGRAPWLKPFAFEGDEDLKIADWALTAVGAGQLAERNLSELSGGERQRIVIARALAQGSRVLLADEPTAHLDLWHAVVIVDLLRRLAVENRLAVVLVTHDINLAASRCDRLVLLNGGRVVAEGEPYEVVDPEILEEVFGVPVRVDVNADCTPFVIPPIIGW